MEQTEKILVEIQRLKKELDGYTASEGLDYIESYINLIRREHSLSSNLYESAKEIAYSVCRQLPNGEEKDNIVYYAILAAMAGAKWQIDHTPLPEDTVLFNKGVEEGKRLMMEETVEGEVMTNGFYPYEPRIVAPYPNCPYDFGDKVRVIVCKKED